MWSNFVESTQQPFFIPVLSFLNVVMVFLTGLVMLLAWIASKKANDLQLLPLLTIYFRGRALTNREIRIRNIGNGPAYNIKIEPFFYLIQDAQAIWKLTFDVPGSNVLIPVEERTLKLTTTIDDKKTEDRDFLVFTLDPEEDHERKRIKLAITFMNAEGNNFYTVIETGIGGLVTIKPASRLNIWVGVSLLIGKIREVLWIRGNQFKWKYFKKRG